MKRSTQRKSVEGLAAAFVLALLLLSPHSAHADGPDTPSAQEQPDASPMREPIDVVYTREGDVFEGIIVERVAGAGVTIQLMSGEFRSFEESEILFAGDLSEWNPDALDAPLPTASADERSAAAHALEPDELRLLEGDGLPAAAPVKVFRLRIRSETGHELRLQREELRGVAFVGSRVIPRTEVVDLCVTPCEVDVPGDMLHVMAQREGRDRTVLVEDPVFVNADASYVVQRVSRRGRRIAMYTIGAFLTFASVAVAVDSVNDPYRANEDDLAASIGGFAAGTALVVFGARTRDGYRLVAE